MKQPRLLSVRLNQFLFFFQEMELSNGLTNNVSSKVYTAATLRGIEVRIIMDQTASKGYFDEWFKRLSIQFLFSYIQVQVLQITILE